MIMLLFSTILNTNETLNKDLFIKLVFETIQNSTFEENKIPNLKWHGEESIEFSEKNLSLKVEDFRKGNRIAAKYEKKAEDGAIWDTEYVFNAIDRKLSIRLERSYSEDALKQSDLYSGPYFIKKLIDRNVLERDGELDISYRPHIIDDTNRHIINDLEKNMSSFKLPVVLVSSVNHKDTEGQGGIYYLAHNLKGAAHVLFENEIKMEEVDGEEKFVKPHCDIDIYYPNNVMEPFHFSCEDEVITDPLRLRLANEVMRYTNSQLIEEEMTWMGVNNMITSEAMKQTLAEMLKKEDAKKAAEAKVAQMRESMDEEVAKHKEEATKEAEAEANELLETFDNELRNLTDKVQELSEVIIKLKAENAGLQSKLVGQDATPVIHEGEEKELYTGEMKEIVMYFLEDVLEKSVNPDSRAYHVLQDLVKANSFSHRMKQSLDDIDSNIKTYRRMDASTRKILEDIGFVISNDGKHYKLKYYDDDRYWEILGKTPSDNARGRGGKNAAADLKKILL